MNNYFGSFREILQLGHRYNRSCSKQIDSSYGELPIMQQHVINYILKNKETGVYQKDIEKAFLISRSTASTMLKSLEKKGIVQRIPSKEDARYKQLEITDVFEKKFIPIYEEMKKNMMQLNKQMCKNITDQDMKIFNKVLHQMKENLKEGQIND